MVIPSRIRIPDHFSTSLTIVEYGPGISEDLLAFLIQLPAYFHDTRRNDWRRQHFGSDPADIRIRIRINQEIHIWIPEFLIEILVLAEVYALVEPRPRQ